MAKGLALHIGLNHVDANRYMGWSGQLAGCINDANMMKSIAEANGFRTTLLLDEQATAAQVVQGIGQAAQQLASGDLFLLTYSGHGAQVPDTNGDEPDGQDETWVLFDRLLIDDELYQLWSQFASGVRIVMLSDSCHSGTVARVRLYETSYAVRGQGADHTTFRQMPPDLAALVYQRDRDLYATLQWVAGRRSRASLGASVLLISGCQDNQLAADGLRNGLFTETLGSVWNSGAFQGNYRAFWQAIVQRMPSTQSPNYFTTGAADPVFESQRPFQIGGTTTGTGTDPGTTGHPVSNPGASGGPSLSAPCCAARLGSGPRWTINPAPRSFFAIEVATQPELFDLAGHGSQRNDANFFGSWVDGLFPAAATYKLPEAVWNRLRNAPRLYYRLWATESGSGWVGALTTTSDQQAASAPSVEIVD